MRCEREKLTTVVGLTDFVFVESRFGGEPNVYFSPHVRIVVRTTFNSTNLTKMVFGNLF